MLIELAPMKDISLDLEGNVVTKSTGFSGPGFAATLAQGNLARRCKQVAAKTRQVVLNGNGAEVQQARPRVLVSYNAGLSIINNLPDA
ncbi:MAG: hypothetical protein MZV63_49980 [Marinilabiliales bacterium]|nr:hypothetical protein [Marinilabiliales bacterium]